MDRPQICTVIGQNDAEENDSDNRREEERRTINDLRIKRNESHHRTTRLYPCTM